MFAQPSTSTRTAFGKPVLAGLLTLLLLGLSLASRSSSLHGLLHHDFQSAQHHCLLATLADGQIDLADKAPSSPSIPPLRPLPPAEFAVFFCSPDHQLPPGRGPPALS